MRIRVSMLLMMLFPIMASLFGILVAAHNQISILPFYSNGIGFALGIPLSLLIAFRLENKFKNNVTSVTVVSLILLLFSFVFSGVDEVHRWVFIGGLPLNISMICCPLMIFIINTLLTQTKTMLALLIMISVGLILVMQPDAGQATAFVLAVLTLFLFNKNISPLFSAIVFGMGCVIIAIAWKQIDLLPAVKQVELILQIALKNDWSAVGVCLIIFCLLISIVPKSHCRNLNNQSILSIAYIVYFLTQLGVTWLGNFPVPLIGAGVAPVIGWYIILGFLTNHKLSYLEGQLSDKHCYG